MELFRGWWKEELKDLMKVEKERLKETKETDDDRLQRMKAESEGGPPKGGKDTLIVEFSIENIQVVQRRAALASVSDDLVYLEGTCSIWELESLKEK